MDTLLFHCWIIITIGLLIPSSMKSDFMCFYTFFLLGLMFWNIASYESSQTMTYKRDRMVLVLVSAWIYITFP
jgi:ABC-type transport system involved in cytochrome c biogenesis permease subunit